MFSVCDGDAVHIPQCKTTGENISACEGLEIGEAVISVPTIVFVLTHIGADIESLQNRKDVVTLTARQDIIIDITCQCIVIVRANQVLDPCKCVEAGTHGVLCARLAQIDGYTGIVDRIDIGAIRGRVTSRAAGQVVIAWATDKNVIPQTAADNVIPTSSVQNVVLIITCYRVNVSRANDALNVVQLITGRVPASVCVGSQVHVHCSRADI